MIKQKICIVGAGNVGVAIAVDLSQDNQLDVYLLTRKAKIIKPEFTKIVSETGEIIKSKKIHLTDDYSKAISNSDLIIITTPSFLIEQIIENIALYHPKVILFVPGYGGKEMLSSKLSKKTIIAGFDRCFYIARLKNNNTVIASKKPKVRLSCLSKNDTVLMAKFVEELFSIKCEPVDNYLVVSFTPSNPILHTSRLFSLFLDKTADSFIPEMIKFYRNWNDQSSKRMIDMDSELQYMCKQFDKINLSEVIPLTKHYESFTIEDMTKKISSIHSLQNIDSPLVKSGKGYKIDLCSRYFQEDFLFGLCILKGFAEICNIETPNFDEVLNWYTSISKIPILDNQNKLKLDKLKNIPLPQNYGFSNIKQVEDFYLQ